MKIIQIVSHEGTLVGLDENGDIYYLFGSVKGSASWRKVSVDVDTTDFFDKARKPQ